MINEFSTFTIVTVVNIIERFWTFQILFLKVLPLSVYFVIGFIFLLSINANKNEKYLWRIYEQTWINKLGSCFGHHMSQITKNWIEKVGKKFILQYLTEALNTSLHQQQNERESIRYFLFSIYAPRPPTYPITAGRASYSMDSRCFVKKYW